MKNRTKIILSVVSAILLVVIIGCVGFGIWFYHNFEGGNPPKNTYFCFDKYEDVASLLNKNHQNDNYFFVDLHNYDQHIVDSCYVVSSSGEQIELDDITKINSLSSYYQVDNQNGLIGIYIKYIYADDEEKEKINHIEMDNIGISQIAQFKNYYFDSQFWLNIDDVNEKYNYPEFVFNFKQQLDKFSFVEYKTNYFHLGITKSSDLYVMFMYENESISIKQDKMERIDSQQTSLQEAYELQLIDYLIHNW